MTSPAARFAFIVLLAIPGLACPQSESVPSEIKGRWTYQRLSNTFTLSEIKVAPDRTFAAKLEWWTANLTCSIRGDPVSGKVTDTGITWDYVTKPPCNQAYTVELVRGKSGWEGKATGKSSSVVADIKAE